jgi:hypothetical protein
MDNLPEDALRHIISFLEMQEIITTVGIVCQNWYHITTDPTHFSNIYLSPSRETHPRIVSSCATLRGNGISDELLSTIAYRYPQLKELTIQQKERNHVGPIPTYRTTNNDYQLPEKIDSEYLKYSGQLFNLPKTLEHELTYKGYVAIALGCRKLTRLSLFDCTLTEAPLRALCWLNHDTLEELVLDTCRYDKYFQNTVKIKPSGIIEANPKLYGHLNEVHESFNFPNLKALVFKSGIEFTNMNLPKLKYLEISCECLRSESELYAPSLEYLTLYHSLSHVPKILMNSIIPTLIGIRLVDIYITSAILDQILTTCTLLRHLEIVGVHSELSFSSNMFSLDLLNKSYCSNLKVLRLRCGLLDNMCLERISKLFPRLTTFALKNNKCVDDYGLAKLLECSILTNADVSSCKKVGDDFLLFLAEKSNVTDLTISVRGISDTGLRRLITSKVRKLTLKGTHAPQVTFHQIEELRKAGIQVQTLITCRSVTNDIKALYNTYYNKNDGQLCLFCRQQVRGNVFEEHRLLHEEILPQKQDQVSTKCFMPNCMFMELESQQDEWCTSSHRILDHIYNECSYNIVKCHACKKMYPRNEIERHACAKDVHYQVFDVKQPNLRKI